VLTEKLTIDEPLDPKEKNIKGNPVPKGQPWCEAPDQETNPNFNCNTNWFSRRV